MTNRSSHQKISQLYVEICDREPDNTTQVNFTDQSVIDDDGWICDINGELLMWIPPLHRISLRRPSTIWVSGKHETSLDLSHFVHGRGWMRCIDSQRIEMEPL
jgi:hypothetical protein